MGQVEAESVSPSQEQPKARSSFDMGAVLTLSAAHGAHDLYTGFLAPLLPVLIEKLSMPLGVAGALAATFRAGSLSQPFFGLWADRSDTRYFVIAAPAITGLCMSLLGLAPNYFTLALLLAIAGLSHGAFHPASASTVTRFSGSTWGKGMSFYMTGGKIGFAMAPLFIVAIVTWAGLENSYMAALPGALFSLLLYLQLRNKKVTRAGASSAAGIWRGVKAQRRVLLFLSGYVLFRASANVSFNTFYPTFLVDRGSTLVFAGLAMSVYQVVGSGGALLGGILSDRFGRRKTMMVSQLISGPLMLLALLWPEGLSGLALLGIAGFVNSAATPVQLTLFQELMPGGRSTAAGIWSFLSFEGQVFTAVLVGVIADQIGLARTLEIVVLTSMLSVPFLFGLKEPKRSE